jgi:hypothetical protein
MQRVTPAYGRQELGLMRKRGRLESNLRLTTTAHGMERERE